MSNNAQVTIVGNIARDPEMRFTPNGAAVANFGVAVNRRWFDKKANDWAEEVSFFDVVAWRDLAENVADSITKGMRVVVVGRLEQRTWETQDNEKRSKVEIVADEVAPSLRWSTASITRNERDSGGAQGAGSNSGQQNAAQAPYGDEEPF